ncbi:MAG TPA: PH domain-containing protein [Methanoregulaceae archaeon]|nr:PH domain-containing protein [Methanoregulaceae archaeon]
MNQDLPESGKSLVPSKRLRSLYNLYLIIIVWIGILPWLIPIALFISPKVTLLIGIPIMAIVLFALWWIPKYYSTIRYILTDKEINWKRGVWFKQTGIVPYNRVTNVDILQGPLSRLFLVSSVRIQTAGYSAQAAAELVLAGIEDPENLREIIMRHIHSGPPGAVETFAESGNEAEIQKSILAELTMVRKLLEK